jgi:hypothetical protein
MRNAAFLAAIVLLANLGTAQASGGFRCDMDDDNLKFRVDAAEPESGGYPLAIENTLQFFDPEAPTEFRAFRFEQKDLRGHWLDAREGGSLKLRFSRQGSRKEPFTFVELIINAPRVDEVVYKGSYVLTIQLTEPINKNRSKGSASKDRFSETGFVHCSDF